MLAAAALAGVALAQSAPKLYWVEDGDNTIKRSNLDGSAVETIVSGGLVNPYGIAVRSGHVYWIDGGNKTIKRANLDGSEVTTLVTGLSVPRDMAVTASHIYWVEDGDNAIRRANLNGTGITALVTSGLSQPYGLDVNSSHIYWVDAGTNRLMWADLDGSHPTAIVTSGVSSPRDVALSPSHVYWTNDGDNAIKRANLNGTGVATIVSADLATPRGITVYGSHIYWTDTGNDTIKRASLDGSQVQTLVSSGLTTAYDVAVADSPVSLAPGGDFTEASMEGWRVSQQTDAVSGATYILLRWDTLVGADGYQISVLDNGVSETTFRITAAQFEADGNTYRIARMPGDRLDPDDPDSAVLSYLTVQVQAYMVDSSGDYLYSLPTETQHVSFLKYTIDGPAGSDGWDDPQPDESGIVLFLQGLIDRTGMDIDGDVAIIPIWFMVSGGFAAAGSWLASGGGWSGGGLIIGGIVFTAFWTIIGSAMLGIPILLAVGPAIVLGLAGAWVAKRNYS